MTTAKLFENGRSQTVQLPEECQFAEDEVFVDQIGDIVMLIPKTMKWDCFLKNLDMFSEDFMADGRDQGEQERDLSW